MIICLKLMLTLHDDDSGAAPEKNSAAKSTASAGLRSSRNWVKSASSAFNSGWLRMYTECSFFNCSYKTQQVLNMDGSDTRQSRHCFPAMLQSGVEISVVTSTVQLKSSATMIVYEWSFAVRLVDVLYSCQQYNAVP